MKATVNEWLHLISGKFIIGALIIPLIFAGASGYLFQNGALYEVPLAVIDLDHSTFSRLLIGKIEESQYVQVCDVYDNTLDSDMLLYNEAYSGVLYLPSGLEAAWIQGKSINLGLNLDMTLPAGTNVLRNGLSEVIGTENVGRNSAALVLEVRPLYNPTNLPLMNMVMLFVNVSLLVFLGLSTMKIVPRLRENGDLENALVHPVGIILRTLPYTFTACIAFYLVVGVLKQVGGLRFEANWIQLSVPLFLYMLSTSLMAMLIGWSAPTETKAANRVLFITLPSFLLSGVQIPYAMLPEPMQWVNELLPLSLHFRFLRGMGYKGGELSFFVPEIGHFLFLISLFMLGIFLLMAKEIGTICTTVQKDLDIGLPSR